MRQRLPCEGSNCLHNNIIHPQVQYLFLTLLLSFSAGIVLGLFSLLVLLCCRVCRRRTNENRGGQDTSGAEAPPETAPDVPYPKVSVLQQFLERVVEEPRSTILKSPDGPVTREQLRCCALQCAELLSPHLSGGGSSSTELVALYLQPGPQLIAAVLGVWLAQAAWTPLDRKSPKKRLQELVKQMKPSVVLCDDDSPFKQLEVPVVHAKLSFKVFDRPMVHFEESMDKIAQVIYTSGSTGAPKGVMYTHGRLAHSTHFFAQQCEVRPGCRVLQKTPNIWSVFRHEVYPALSRGGLIVHPDPHLASDPVHLAETINSTSVSLLVATPTVLELVLDSGETLSSLQRVVCMGEPLSWRLVEIIMKQLPAVQIMNFYGSTETENTTYTVPRVRNHWQAASAVPAGQPQPHVAIHLLQPGCLDISHFEGEICFGGVMSSGYWERPDLTAMNFVQHPQLGWLYRTGDLGKWQHGQLVVLGRLDRQVKIRGCRVELQELELTLQQLVADCGGVECAAVAAKGSDHLQIVAFVCPDSEDPDKLDLEVLTREAQAVLSPQLMPSLFAALPKLPRLSNGKVDLMSLKTFASDALVKQDTQTESVIDSLGMLQHLTRTQLEEDRWHQNQQAFWTMLVMMQHFTGILGRGVHKSDDFGYTWTLLVMEFAHGRDMIAMFLLLGFADARREPELGHREGAALVTAMALTLWSSGNQDLAIGGEWFLYTYLRARLVLVGLCRFQSGLWQAGLLFLLSCMLPDDYFWLQFPQNWREYIKTHSSGLDSKGLKFLVFFMPACYLLSFHATAEGAVAWARTHGRNLMRKAEDYLAQYMDPDAALWRLQLSFSLACWTFFVVLSFLTGWRPKWGLEPFAYQFGFQAIYIESGDDWFGPSHSVTWQYMNNPSLATYVALWFGETLLFILPGVTVALAMVYMPVHFKTIGTACFGLYVCHIPIAFWPSVEKFQQNVTRQITNPMWNDAVNIFILLLWSIVFVTTFAHTVGVAFHYLLIAVLGEIAKKFKPETPSSRSQCRC